MIPRFRSSVFAALLIAACHEPTGVSKSPPTDLALAKGGGSGITSALLPTLGGSSAIAYAVNDNGVAVGYITENSGTVYAVRWTPTSSTTWTIAKIAESGSQAYALNTNGAAVGVRDGVAKLWPAGGGEIDLGLGKPSGINRDETIVGIRNPTPASESSQRAVVWKKPGIGWNANAPNTPQDLPAFPGGSGETAAKAINDAGIITGFVGVATSTTASRTVRWDPAGEQWGEPTALPGNESALAAEGRAINDNTDFGGFVRECLAPCSAVGIVWLRGGAGTSLAPFFGSSAGWVNGMNNAQRAVGRRDDPRHGPRAFVWWPGQTSLHNLPGPRGYAATEAFDINNRSPAQAVGSGYGSSLSTRRAIVWTIP